MVILPQTGGGGGGGGGGGKMAIFGYFLKMEPVQKVSDYSLKMN